MGTKGGSPKVKPPFVLNHFFEKYAIIKIPVKNFTV